MRYPTRTILPHVLVCALIIPWFTCCSRLMGVHDPVTGSNVAADQVPFLKLPPSASNVGYWDDGYQQEATFNISEEAFLTLFPDRKFSPISAETDYYVWPFGDTCNSPQKSYRTQTTTAGFIHEETWKNGGRRKIVFDRHRQFCSYEFVRW